MKLGNEFQKAWEIRLILIGKIFFYESFALFLLIMLGNEKP
jgi:hypothetical protein